MAHALQLSFDRLAWTAGGIVKGWLTVDFPRPTLVRAAEARVLVRNPCAPRACA